MHRNPKVAENCIEFDQEVPASTKGHNNCEEAFCGHHLECEKSFLDGKMNKHMIL